MHMMPGPSSDGEFNTYRMNLTGMKKAERDGVHHFAVM
jgi:hypothetical protein